MTLYAPLLTRKRIFKIILEAEKGTKLAGTQAITVFDPAINPTAPFEERRDVGLYRGPKVAGVVGERSGNCSFSSELRGTGAGGMEVGLAILLQACGLFKTAEVYQVHSTPANDKTISIDAWQDGVKKGLAGVSGNVTFAGDVGKRMMCNFELPGIWQAPVDDALPVFAPSTTAPLFIQSGTFTLATESIKIGSFELNMGCEVVPRMDVDGVGGIAYYIITDHLPILTITPEADLVAGHDFHGLWLAGTPAAVSLILQNATDKITFTLPVVQYREVQEGDREGIQIYNLTGQCLHSSGNDSVKVEAAAP